MLLKPTFRCRSARNAKGILLRGKNYETQQYIQGRKLPSSRVICHYKVCEPSLGDVMEQILLPDIGEFTVGIEIHYCVQNMDEIPIIRGNLRKDCLGSWENTVR